MPSHSRPGRNSADTVIVVTAAPAIAHTPILPFVSQDQEGEKEEDPGTKEVGKGKDRDKHKGGRREKCTPGRTAGQQRVEERVKSAAKKGEEGG